MTNLPRGWEVKKLGDIAEISSGGTPSRNKKEYWENGIIPWVKIKDIKENFISTTEEFITEDGSKNSSAKLFKKGTLLYSIFATLGEVAILDIDATTNQAIAGINIKENNANSLYLMYFLKSIKDEICNKGRGVAQNNLNLSILKQIQVPLPPLKEQERIVGILDESFANIDESIKILEQDLLNLDELMQSALQKAFNPLKDNAKENYQLPQGWEWKSLEDIANIKGGKRLPKDEKLLDYKTPFPYIRVSDFQDDGTIDLHNVKFINEKTYNILSNYQIDNTNLYISIAGTIGKSGIIPKSLNGAILTENAIKLEYKNYNIYDKFMYYFTTSSCFKNQAIESTRIVAQPKLAISRLKTIKIPIPPLQEQEQIASYLDELSLNIKDLKQNYQTQIKNLQELKKSLLDRAFKGRL